MLYTTGKVDSKSSHYNDLTNMPGGTKDDTKCHLLLAYTDPSGHIPVWGIINAGFGALDGYRYAKKKNLKGIKKVGAIVGGAVLGTVNPFKKVKVSKVVKRVTKVAKKRKSTKAIVKRVSRSVRKARVVTKRATRKVSKKAFRTYRKVKCKITKKGCFTAGTLVSTQDGDVPIEDIEEGDLVWAQDPETGEVALKRVVQTFVKETDTILYIKVAGQVIEATEQHVFYIDNVGWIPASMIEEGDKVVLQSGDKSTVEKIDKVVHNELITVYNFEVEDFHTYFVSDASVLVHNNGCVGEPSSKKRRKGRAGKQKRLRQMAEDDKLSSALRGEIKRDINQIKRKKRKNIRVPKGYQMAHKREYEASKGFGYEYSNLNTISDHKRQHKFDNNGKKRL